MKNYQCHSNYPYSSHTARKRTSNIAFTEWLGQRHLSTMSNSWTPKLYGELLPSLSGILPKQLNMKVLILMFSWPFLDAVGDQEGECLLIARLGLVGKLKSKRKSN